MCNWEVSSWRKHLSVNSPNNPTRGRAMKGDLGIDDNCKRGIGVRGRAEEPARGLKRRSTRKGAWTQVGFCEDAVYKQSVSFPAAAGKGSLGSHLNEKLKLCIVPALLLPCLGRPAAQLEMHISYFAHLPPFCFTFHSCTHLRFRYSARARMAGSVME